MGRLIDMKISSDIFLICLLSFFKLGIKKSIDPKYKGISIVFGFWRFESQIFLGLYLEKCYGEGHA